MSWWVSRSSSKMKVVLVLAVLEDSVAELVVAGRAVLVAVEVAIGATVSKTIIRRYLGAARVLSLKDCRACEPRHAARLRLRNWLDGSRRDFDTSRSTRQATVGHRADQSSGRRYPPGFGR